MLAGWVAATHHPGVLLHTGALRKGGLSPGVQLTLLWLPQPFCRAEKLCAGLSPGVSYAQPRWVSAQSPPQPAANPSRVPARLRREPGLRQSSAGTGEAGRGDLQQFHLTGAALRSPSDESRHVPGSDVLCPQAPCCPASTVLAALALLAGSPPLAPQYFDSLFPALTALPTSPATPAPALLRTPQLMLLDSGFLQVHLRGVFYASALR